MESILRDLWNGNLSPTNEKETRYEEAKNLMGLIDRHTNALQTQLNDTEKQTFEKLDDCYTELAQIEREDAFANGFSLGVKLVFSAFGRG